MFRKFFLRIAFLFGFASLASWMPMLNLWIEEKGLSGNIIGYLAAIPWLVMLFVQPLWGIIADKFGKLNCFRATCILAALAFAVFPFIGAHSFSIAAIILLMSLFYTPVLPLLDSIALDQIEAGDSSYSNIRFWGAPGFGLGAYVAGLLIPKIGIDAIFYLSAIFLVLMFISLAGLKELKSSSKSIDLEFRHIGKLFGTKMLPGFLFVIVIVATAQASSSFYLTIYLKEIGANSQTTGTAIGIQALSELPIYFIAPLLLKKLGSKNMLLISIFATVLRLFLYSVNSYPERVMFIETLNGITWALLWIAAVEFVNEAVPAQWRTTGQSLLWAAYFGAGSIAGNILSGRLYELMPMQKVFGINAVIVFGVGILATLIFVLARKPELKMPPV